MDMCRCVLQIQHASTSSYCSSQGACFLSMAYARQPGIPPSGSQLTTERDGVYIRIYAGGGENIPDLSHLISSHLISSHLSLSYIHTYIHYITLHSIPFHSITLHYIPFHSIPLHYITYIHTYIYIYIYACTCMYKYRYPVRRRKTLPGWLAVPGFHLFYDDWHSPQLCWMLIRALLMFRAAPSSRFPSCSNWARPTIAFAIR